MVLSASREYLCLRLNNKTFYSEIIILCQIRMLMRCVREFSIYTFPICFDVIYLFTGYQFLNFFYKTKQECLKLFLKCELCNPNFVR